MHLTTEYIWNAFHVPLAGFIRKRVRDETMVEDLLQEVFLKIHQSIDTLHDVRKLESWIYQIARHTIVDAYRRTRPAASLESSEALALPEELPTDDVVSALFPCVRAMVNNLPELDRQALVLTEYRGLTQKELSEHLGISISGAKSRVQRARARLKQQLLACCHFELDRRGHVINYHPHCHACATDTCRTPACASENVSLVLSDVRPSSKLHVSHYEVRTLPDLQAHCTQEEISMETIPSHDDQLRAEVSARYARTALHTLNTVQEQKGSQGCCGSGCCSTTPSDGDAITSDLYSPADLDSLPLAAALASRGCGNPIALAELRPGEIVLDLGSGGGIDVLLSARRVGPAGFVYGLDMTDEMLALAERNRAEAGVENVRFLKGVIEAIPLAEHSVNVIISNCVVNLSADKQQVLHEAYRVLTPGGRLAVADIVFQGSFPAALRADLESWAGCIAGALEETTYRHLLAEAGFTDIEVEVTRRYSLDDISESGARTSLAALSEQERAEVDGKFVSAFIRARKPA